MIKGLIPVYVKNFLKRLLQPCFSYFLFMKTSPFSVVYGLDRGEAIDRYYIENFLGRHEKDIKGKCLEVLGNDYTMRYGAGKVIKSDILDIDRNNKNATVYGDLRHLDDTADNQYDCVILTQVLQFIDEYEAAIKECFRILKPGGGIIGFASINKSH